MISVVIPGLNAEHHLGACLEALIDATIDGLVREVIVVDGGSDDRSVDIAEGFGARVLQCAPGRGTQLNKGGAAAKSDWLLFLHADTVLEEGWESEARRLIEAQQHDAGVFTLAFVPNGWRAKLVALGAMQRTRWLGSPYGDQGLLISKKAYEAVGGFAKIPLFEDVDFIDRFRRLKDRHAMYVFRSRALTSAARYEEEGYLKRVLKNFLLMVRYRFGASPDKLAKAYEK